MSRKPHHKTAKTGFTGVTERRHGGSGRPHGVQGIYGPGSNVVECAADLLRLLGHNMPPAGEELEAAD